MSTDAVITVQIPEKMYQDAKAVKAKTGLGLSSLIRLGLVDVIAEYQERINETVIDKDTMALMREYEIETGITPKQQVKAAVSRWLHYKK